MCSGEGLLWYIYLSLAILFFISKCTSLLLISLFLPFLSELIKYRNETCRILIYCIMCKMNDVCNFKRFYYFTASTMLHILHLLSIVYFAFTEAVIESSDDQSFIFPRYFCNAWGRGVEVWISGILVIEDPRLLWGDLTTEKLLLPVVIKNSISVGQM